MTMLSDDPATELLDELLDAIDHAKALALAAHQSGECYLSEWSCSYCEATSCCPRADQVLSGYVVTIRCTDGSEATEFLTMHEAFRSGFTIGPAVAVAAVDHITIHDCLGPAAAARR